MATIQLLYNLTNNYMRRIFIKSDYTENSGIFLIAFLYYRKVSDMLIGVFIW